MLSSDDPVRVFQDFATVDLLSGGRAEIMAGRGSFIESFPLFGYDLDDYDELFAEKLELLLKLRESERVTWSGEHRAPLDGLGVYPRPVQNPLPIWIAVGGTPQSVVRAGELGLPLALAIIGGEPERFAPLVDLYRERRAKARATTRRRCRSSINSHGFIADTSQQAADDVLPAVRRSDDADRPRARLAADDAPAVRGVRAQPRGALFVGSPEQVVEKILFQHELFGHDRFLAQLSVGTLPHAKLMRSIEHADAAGVGPPDRLEEQDVEQHEPGRGERDQLRQLARGRSAQPSADDREQQDRGDRVPRGLAAGDRIRRELLGGGDGGSRRRRTPARRAAIR